LAIKYEEIQWKAPGNLSSLLGKAIGRYLKISKKHKKMPLDGGRGRISTSIIYYLLQ
jgi:hypothetical protein